MPQGLQDASWDDIITAAAKANGVNPKLAIAVAKRESSLNPGAVGDGGKALGMFQLHPGAATDTGTADRSDPIQNITGGVKYLKQLNDRYQGDLTKVLQAYNGGMGNVDNNTVSPEAAKYADEVLQGLMGGSQAAPAPSAPTAAPAAPVDPELVNRGIDPAHDKTKLAKKVEPPGVLRSMAQDMAASFDPTTTAGRVNLAATGAATAATAFAGGAGGPLTAAGIGLRAVVPSVARGVVPWIARVLAGPVAAGVAGGGVMAAEQAAGTAPEGSNSPIREGLTQGALESFGSTVGWGVRRIAKPVLATKVGRFAKESLEDLKTTLSKRLGFDREASRAAVGAAREQATDANVAASARRDIALQGAEETADKRLAAARELGQQRVSTVSADVKAAKTSAEQAGAASVARTARQAADAVADAELDADDVIKTANRAYELVSGRPPSVQGAAQAARKTLAGIPGVEAEGHGPVRRALDMAGQEVSAAAKVGPAVSTKELKAELNAMAESARPSAIFGQVADEADEKVVGFGPKKAKAASDANVVRYGEAARSALQKFKASTLFKPNTKEYNEGVQAALATAKEKFDQGQASITAKQMGVSENHPLPGLLGQILDAPDEMSFADLHQTKRLLDEAVNWDEASKKHLARLTKGIRTKISNVLREASPEYAAAADKYADVVKLQRKGVGRAIVKAANDNPDQIAKLLDASKPHAALQLRRLLVEQAAEGGSPDIGREAWDAVRGSFTFNHIIKGGAEGLTKRLHDVIEGHPEFARAVYGDDMGKMYLSNLDKIGEAYAQAAEKAKGLVEGAKTAGKGAVAGAKERAAAGVAEASDLGQTALEGAKQTSTKGVEAARTINKQGLREAARAGKADIAATAKAGRADVKTAQRAGDAAIKQTKGEMAGVREQQKALQRSSIGPFSSRVLETQFADMLRTGGLGVGTIWGALSALRLLTNNPHSADIIEWAALSGKNTELLTKLLLGQHTDRAAADAMRAVMGAAKPTPQPQAAGQ